VHGTIRLFDGETTPCPAKELRAIAAHLLSIANAIDKSVNSDTLWLSSTVSERDQLMLLVWAEAEYNGRRKRQALINNALLGEPAWDVLLNLYIQEMHRRYVTVAGACKASGVSKPTALRWLSMLEVDGLIERVPCADDRRKRHVRLTDKARLALIQWLQLRAAA
jgi:DNA-binding MarR family transcriptional regulator